MSGGYTPLAKEQAISQEQLDDATQANLAAEAQVKADEASVLTAQLNLGFTRIISPVDGLAGIALAQTGDLVGQSGKRVDDGFGHQSHQGLFSSQRAVVICLSGDASRRVRRNRAASCRWN